MTLTGKVIALTLFIPESRLADRCAKLIISSTQNIFRVRNSFSAQVSIGCAFHDGRRPSIGIEFLIVDRLISCKLKYTRVHTCVACEI